MTIDERIELFKGRLLGNEADNVTDDTVEVFLNSAKGIIFDIRYQSNMKRPNDVEECYHYLQIEIALELYSKSGSEGEVSHTEGNISRTYLNAGVSKDLLSRITPLCGVL